MRFAGVGGRHMKVRSAIISGASGYIGRKTASRMLQDGWNVYLLVRPGQAKTLSASPGCLQYIEYDGNQSSLASLSGLCAGQTVFIHLAARSTLDNEIQALTEMAQSNFSLGLSLIESMLQFGFKKVVITESYWQFGAKGEMQGNSLYASTKSAFSLVFEYLSRRYLSGISLVIYDVYGPADPRGKLLSKILRQSDTCDAIELTPGEQLLDFTHVHDVASALVVASQRLIDSRSCPSFERHTARSMRVMALRDFVSLMEQHSGRKFRLRWGARPYPAHQIMAPWLPGHEAQLPGWQPSTSFEEGVKDLYEPN
jgi:nucleoside-diphosphate-sugar epimerase